MLHKIKLPVHSIAHGRAGDKGDVSNVSLIAYNKFGWENIRENATMMNHTKPLRIMSIIQPTAIQFISIMIYSTVTECP